jgi:hypothetical protein
MHRRTVAAAVLALALSPACASSGADPATTAGAAPPELEIARVAEGAAAHPRYELSVAYPVVTGPDPRVAARIQTAVDAWVSEVIATYVREDAEFVDGDDDLPPGMFQVAVAPGPPNPHLLNVRFDGYEMHRGAAHPWMWVETMTFDLTTGDPVALEELFAGPVLETVSRRAVAQLTTALDPEGDGWADEEVRNGAAPEADLLRRVVLAEEGLVVHFDQYQVAPGVAGPQAATVSWPVLLDALEPSPAMAAWLRDVASLSP